MARFEFRDYVHVAMMMLVAAAMEEDENEEEVLLASAAQIALANRPSVRPRIPATPKNKFDLEALPPEEARRRLRFTVPEVMQVLPYLGLQNISYRYRYKPTPQTAVSVFLARLACETRLQDLPEFFGLSAAYIDTVFNDVLQHVNRRFGDFLRWDSRRLTWPTIRKYADAVNEDGKIWGFIGSYATTIRPPAPDAAPRYYSVTGGFCVRWQGVVTPDGLCSSLAGPVEGSYDDVHLFKNSSIEDEVLKIFKTNEVAYQNRAHLYGPPWCLVSPVTTGAFTCPDDAAPPLDQDASNTRLAEKLASTEKFFRYASSTFALCEQDDRIRRRNTPVAAIVTAAVLMANCLTCLRGRNEISDAFGLEPPSLGEYLAAFNEPAATEGS